MTSRPVRQTTIVVKDRPHRLKSGFHGGWLPDRPNPHEDWPLSKRLDTQTALPENPFLDPSTYPDTRDQGNQGSCTGHGMTNVLEQRLLSRDKKFWSKFRLSPASAYLNGRKIDGSVRSDAGSYIRSVVKGAAVDGVAREDACPYDPGRLLTRLSSAAATSAKWHQALRYYRCDEPGRSTEQTVDNIIRALEAKLPVIFGFTCFTNLDEAGNDGLIRLPGPGDSEDNGHCMTMFEADTRSRVFIGPNSWGEWGAEGRNGQMGYFRLPFDYFIRGFADDAWALDHE